MADGSTVGADRPQTNGGASASNPSATVQQSAAGQNVSGWFYLDSEGQHVGPFTTDQLAGYHASGYVPRETYVWAQGRSEWQPLHAVQELAAAAVASGASPAADAAGGDTGTAVRQTDNAVESAGTAMAAEAASARLTGGRIAAAAPAVLSAAPVQQDPLATFTAEISAIEAENEAAEQPASPAEKSFVDDDGTAYEWDPKARRFVEIGAGGDAGGPQYDVSDMTFAGEAEVIPPMPELPNVDEGDEQVAAGGKRKGPDQGKLDEAVEREKAKKQKAKEDAAEKAKWFELQRNSSVYVSGLPLDAADAEMVKVFTKCGVIKLDDERRPRVKIYKDEDGTGKGDGLVTYLKAPSVDLAIQILDGTPLRDGDTRIMSVSQAKFEQKGDFVAKKRAPKKRKKKLLENQEERELGWGGFDDVAPATKTTVVLRRMFHPDEFAEDFTLREQLEDDVTGEAAKLGMVEKVKIYNTNPEGVVTVKFHDEDAAAKCIMVMHERFFGGRQIQAALWDGIEQFYAKPAKPNKETEEEEQKRLEKYAAELEAAEAAAPKAEPAVPMEADS